MGKEEGNECQGSYMWHGDSCNVFVSGVCREVRGGGGLQASVSKQLVKHVVIIYLTDRLENPWLFNITH